MSNNVDRLYNALVTRGKQLTAKQITSQFGFTNPYDAIYRLRQSGVNVVLVSTTNSRGTTTNKYMVKSTKR